MRHLEKLDTSRPVDKDINWALHIAEGKSPNAIKETLRQIYSAMNKHYSTFYDSDSPVDLLMLEHTLGTQIPGYEAILAWHESFANLIMQSGTDGAALSMLKLIHWQSNIDPPAPKFAEVTTNY